MSGPSSPPNRRDRRRRAAVLRWMLALGALAAVFVLGVALGASLDDNPDTGRTQTYVRTLQPLSVAPATETLTVTTTVTAP